MDRATMDCRHETMNQKKHTVRTIQKMRDNGEIITMLTAYDYPTAKQINDAGIDTILVGDSCAMVVHGHPNTLTATMDMMVLHCAAVARGCSRTMVIADMPFGSFQYSVEDTMRNAARFVTEAKVDAVKFEATPNHIEKTRAIVEMGWIPHSLQVGQSGTTVGPDLWRTRVVSSPQFHENHVLTETFAFNLLMGRSWPPQPDDFQAAVQICEELGLGELLQRLPAGFQQMVGESGWRLSHGERSRLYIARALLHEPRLLQYLLLE